MLRQIIEIDEEKCNGCGACANACHEGAIAMIDGVAKLIRDDYCDGFGDCLPTCPTGAICFVQREAAAYDEAAVQANMAAKKLAEQNAAAESFHAAVAEARTAAKAAGISEIPEGGCPGSRVMNLQQNTPQPAANQPASSAPAGGGCPGSKMRTLQPHAGSANTHASTPGQPAPAAPGAGLGPAGGIFVPLHSELGQWPCQIKLVPVHAPFFADADLLIAADCTAFAYAAFHQDFIHGKTTIIGCPKLDNIDYSEKLTQIITSNSIRSITIVRMEVPCCSGLDHAARNALAQSGKTIPCQTYVISLQGELLN